MLVSRVYVKAKTLLVAALWLAIPVMAQQRQSWSVSWTPKKTEVPLAVDKLRIELPDATPNVDWIVGVRTDTSKPPSLILGEVHFATRGPGYPHVRPIAQIIDWPTGLVQAKPGLLTVFGMNRPGISLLVYLNLPVGSQIQITAASNVVASAQVTNTWIVHNGNVLGEEVLGIRTLSSRLVFPRRPDVGGDILRTRTGDYLATVNGLRSHLVSSSPLEYAGPGQGVSAPTHGILRIRIDEAGNVTVLLQVLGDQQLLDACQRAVIGWKFRPFLVEGAAVPVLASLLFEYDPKTGTVRSPVLP